MLAAGQAARRHINLGIGQQRRQQQTAQPGVLGHQICAICETAALLPRRHRPRHRTSSACPWRPLQRPDDLDGRTACSPGARSPWPISIDRLHRAAATAWAIRTAQIRQAQIRQHPGHGHRSSWPGRTAARRTTTASTSAAARRPAGHRRHRPRRRQDHVQIAAGRRPRSQPSACVIGPTSVGRTAASARLAACRNRRQQITETHRSYLLRHPARPSTACRENVDTSVITSRDTNEPNMSGAMWAWFHAPVESGIVDMNSGRPQPLA